MLANFVQETANAPGSATTINLAGPPTGRRGFLAAFASGSSVYYFMDDGTQAEWGIGTVTAGTPNTLARTNVLGNSANTTARLNFTGSVRVYNEVPAERVVALMPDAAAARTTLGAGTVGALLFQAATAAGARSDLGATVTGAEVFTAPTAAAARTAIGAPATPTATGGVAGHWTSILPGSGNAAVLPAGGTWAYFSFRVTDSTGALDGNYGTGLAAGGTTVGAAVAGRSWVGVAWRIA